MQLLSEAARESGAAVVLVTHEARVAAWSDREVVVRDGRTRSLERGGVSGERGGGRAPRGGTARALAPRADARRPPRRRRRPARLDARRADGGRRRPRRRAAAARRLGPRCSTRARQQREAARVDLQLGGAVRRGRRHAAGRRPRARDPLPRQRARAAGCCSRRVARRRCRPASRGCPAPGEMVVSPRLERLLDAGRRRRCCASGCRTGVVGEIGDSGLSGPAEYALYVGSDRLAAAIPRRQRLRRQRRRARIDSFGGAPASPTASTRS